MMTLFGGNLLSYFFGILLGHLYIFVKDIAVVQYRKDYLPTPRWFSNWYYGRVQVGERREAGIFGGRGVQLG